MQQTSILLPQEKEEVNVKVNCFFHQKLKEFIGIRSYFLYFQNIVFNALNKETFGIICQNKNEAEQIYEKFGLKIQKLIKEIWKNSKIKQKYFYRNEEQLVECVVNKEFIEKIEGEVISFTDKNTNQTFDNFVVANENITAFNVCQSIACANKMELIQAGSIVHLYGETSTGKTHLLNSVYNFYNSIGGKVYYTTSSMFLRKYVEAVKLDKCLSFQDEILKNDIILIDNIDNLLGKNGTLIALKQLISLATEQQKYIILTSKQNKKTLSINSNIFNNILSNSISLALKEQTNETKTKIIMKYIYEKNQKLSISIANDLVEKMNCNVRELKNCIKKLSIIQKVKNFEINSALALSILKDNIEEKKQDNTKQNITNEKIIEVVAKYFKVKENDIISKIKTANVCLARNIVMFLIRDINSANYQEIGKLLNRNHSTIISGIKNIEYMLQNDSKLPSIMAEIKSQLI